MSDDLFRRGKPAAMESSASHKRNAVLDSIARRGSSLKQGLSDERSEEAHISSPRNIAPLMSASAPLGKALAAAAKSSEVSVAELGVTDTTAPRPRSSVAKLRSITAAAHEEEPAIDTDIGAIDCVSLDDTLSPHENSPYKSPTGSSAQRLEDSILACQGSVRPDHEVDGGILGLSMNELSMEGSHGSSVITAPLTQSHVESELDTINIKSSPQSKDRLQHNEIHNTSLPLTKANVKEITATAVNEVEDKSRILNKAQNNSEQHYNAVAKKSAMESWDNYLKLNDSIITDLFSGQLQNTVECLECHHRFLPLFLFVFASKKYLILWLGLSRLTPS